MVGYRVAADRRLFPSYASVLTNQISRAKQISTPLSSLQTRDEAQIPGVYSLFHVAVDHLVSITPAGLPPSPRTSTRSVQEWPGRTRSERRSV